jgi:phage/plasmid-associated DNA primase
MRENFSTFKPTAKLWMVGNHRPIVAEDDPATWERQRVIPIDRTIPEAGRDPQLQEKLRADASGALNWVVAGCLAWQHERLGQSAKIRAATCAYREESDRLAPFLGERCSTSDPDAVARRSVLFAAYVAWATAQGERRPMPERVFAEAMRGHGFAECNPRFDGHQRKAWRGIRLLDTADTPMTSPFPVKPHEKSSSQSTGNSDVKPVSAVSVDPPDPLALLEHCLRARLGTTATDGDRQALAAHFRGLNGTAFRGGSQ